MKFFDYDQLFKDNVTDLSSFSNQDFEPITYEDSFERRAVEDLARKFNDALEKSSAEQRRVNIVLIVLGSLTLIATVAGVVIQIVQ